MNSSFLNILKRYLPEEAKADESWLQALQQNATPAQPMAVSVPPAQVAAMNQAPTQAQVAQAAGVQPPPMPPQPDQNDALLAQLAQQRKNIERIQAGSLAQQRAGLEAQRQSIADTVAAGAPQVDLSALMAMVDSMTGSKLSAGYKRPTSAAENAKLIAELEDKLQGRRKELTQNELTLLQDKLAGRIMEGNARQSRFETSQALKTEDNLVRDMNKNVFNPMNEFEQSVAVVESALADGSVGRLNQALSQFTRLQGQKGVLTDQDVAMQIPDTYAMRLAQAKAKLSGKPTEARAPEDIIKLMRENLADARKAVANAMEKRVKDREKIYSAGSYAPLMAQGRVGSVTFEQAKSAISGLKPAQSPVANLPVSQDAIKAELARRGLVK